MVNEDHIKKILRSKAEAKVKQIPDSNLDITMEKARVLMHELEVHQVELEMQNQELRETLHLLEDARDQYTDLFDFAPVGYLILNDKGIITNINLTACNLLGLERSLIKGKPFSVYLQSKESNTFFLKLREAFNSGTLPTLEFQLKRKDETDFTAIIHGTVDNDHNTDIPVCRIAIQDVTEIRKVEALEQRQNDLVKEKSDIQKYNEELEKIVKERTKELSDALESERSINEMKSAFITIASHELRTPITVVLSSVILIEKFKSIGQFNKIDRHIDRIKVAIKNFTSILDDFLSLEKLERGVVRVKKETFDITDFIQRVTEEMEGILKPDQHINYIHEGNITVKQDQKILHNILVNLLTNAIKYSETHVSLKTKNENDVLTVSVQDKGIGIPEDDKKNLFRRFFRAKNVNDFQGTGLGLSIVERYLELLGGKIHCTSTLGKGSTFTIELPYDTPSPILR